MNITEIRDRADELAHLGTFHGLTPEEERELNRLCRLEKEIENSELEQLYTREDHDYERMRDGD